MGDFIFSLDIFLWWLLTCFYQPFLTAGGGQPDRSVKSAPASSSSDGLWRRESQVQESMSHHPTKAYGVILCSWFNEEMTASLTPTILMYSLSAASCFVTIKPRSQLPPLSPQRTQTGPYDSNGRLTNLQEFWFEISAIQLPGEVMQMQPTPKFLDSRQPSVFPSQGKPILSSTSCEPAPIKRSR